jgi:hypothetical protein
MKVTEEEFEELVAEAISRMSCLIRLLSLKSL